MILGALCAPSFLHCQNNRITIQTGLFHSFLDGTPIISKSFKKQNPDFDYNRRLSSLFGGVLNDSKGVQLQRRINEKSSVSFEYMVLNCAYDYEEVYNNSTVKPILVSRQLKYANINYSRNMPLHEKINFVFGGGLNYIWGHERLYHYTYLNGWGEPRFYGHYRNDFGLNARAGVDYSPVKWLTISSNFDFLGILYSGGRDSDGNKLRDYYKEKFGLTKVPSYFDLSWRFGVGFNF